MEILDNEIDIYQSPEEHEWETFIGPNANYYIPIWHKFQKQDIKIHVHLPALFLNIYWVGYRKMYKYAISYLLFLQIIPLLIFFSIDTGGYFEVQFMLLFSYPLFGLFSNWLYYKHAQKVIADIKRSHSNEVSRQKALQEAGQTNSASPFILFFLSIFLGLFVPLILTFFN